MLKTLKTALSMRQVSSCDFVTRLPVCDKEAFPIYKEFSAAENVQPKQIVQTNWYQKAKPQSRYLRAYLVEKVADNTEKTRLPDERFCPRPQFRTEQSFGLAESRRALQNARGSFSGSIPEPRQTMRRHASLGKMRARLCDRHRMTPAQQRRAQHFAGIQNTVKTGNGRAVTSRPAAAKAFPNDW